MNIQETALKSAEIYYQYATSRDKGTIEYVVRSIKENGVFFDVELASAIPSFDNMKVRIHNVLYEDDQIKIMEYQEKNHIVRLVPSPDCRALLQNCSASDLLLVTNVRFLIKCTEDWYLKYGHLVSLPSKAPTVTPYKPRKIENIPSHDQKAAIQGILNAPFSYVWGAPGTGKTQFVLAQSLLTYIKRSKKVLITAPTNRALEQILYGILPVLESVNIPMERILRLGVPSAEFAQKYPVVCENHRLRSLLIQTQQQIETVKIQLEQFQQTANKQKRHQNYLIARAKFEAFATKATPWLDQLETLIANSKESLKSINSYPIQEASLNQEFDRLSVEIVKTKNQIQNGEKQLKKLQTSLLKGFFKRKSSFLQEQIVFFKQTLAELETKRRAIYKQQQETKIQAENEENEYQKNLTQQKELICNLQSFSHILIELHLLTVQSVSDHAESLSNFRTALQKGISLFKAKEEEYADMPPYDAQKTISEIHLATVQLEQLNQALNTLTTKQHVRLDKCCVMAATIDGCITKVLPDGDFQPTHIFLDEAGYAPLIKAATLTAFHCPITLLGDHMQLPPVCEMNEEQFSELQFAPVVLWAQSALYLEDLFAFPFETVHQRYLEHQPPLFEKLKKFDLLYSYRFSDSLASVLAGDVYNQALIGTGNHETRIFYINAPYKSLKNTSESEKPILKRYNPAECDAIEKFVKQNDDLEIGIITPYKNQKNALRKRIRNSIEVNTVHGSQGREWDCVVFSVVDTTDQWFTNSLLPKSNGKNVVNTAVSRAKKQLVLVCDANYWSTQKNQLIGKLLSIAQELKL